MKKIILLYILTQSLALALDIKTLTPDAGRYASLILEEDSNNMSLLDSLNKTNDISVFGRAALEYDKSYLDEKKKTISIRERIYLFKFVNAVFPEKNMRKVLNASPYYIKINDSIFENPSEIDLDVVSKTDKIYFFQKARFSDKDKFLKAAKIAIENKLDNVRIENLYFDIDCNPEMIENDIKTGIYQNYYKEEYNLTSSEDFSKSYPLYKKLLNADCFTKGDIRTILSLKSNKNKLELFEEVMKSDKEDKPYQLKKLIQQR